MPAREFSRAGFLLLNRFGLS